MLNLYLVEMMVKIKSNDGQLLRASFACINTTNLSESRSVLILEGCT
jgi:hypothetical protein